MKKLRTPSVISTTAPSVISTTAHPVISTTAGRRNLHRARRGFSLPEMLIAVLLLGFVSVMVTVMTSAILSTSAMMKEVAQAEILGNEALENVQGQLRFAQNIEVKEGNVTFDPDKNNTGYTFVVDEEGKIVLRHKKDGKNVDDLLFAGVSYGNLSVESLNFEVGEDKRSILVSVAVSYGSKTIWNGSVSVRPLNGILTIT